VTSGFDGAVSSRDGERGKGIAGVTGVLYMVAFSLFRFRFNIEEVLVLSLPARRF
jgi:hypothetical protein